MAGLGLLLISIGLSSASGSDAEGFCRDELNREAIVSQLLASLKENNSHGPTREHKPWSVRFSPELLAVLQKTSERVHLPPVELVRRLASMADTLESLFPELFLGGTFPHPTLQVPDALNLPEECLFSPVEHKMAQELWLGLFDKKVPGPRVKTPSSVSLPNELFNWLDKAAHALSKPKTSILVGVLNRLVRMDEMGNLGLIDEEPRSPAQFGPLEYLLRSAGTGYRKRGKDEPMVISLRLPESVAEKALKIWRTEKPQANTGVSLAKHALMYLKYATELSGFEFPEVDGKQE